MKTLKLSLVLGCVAIATVASFAFKGITPATKKINASNGFAVVELFTSEGCSSCPPADELVARVEKESAGKPVYILAYHVDYWNRLGWKDVFSSAEYSQRQNQYANWLHLQSVYTPQIVVNGKTEFVGSEEGNLRNAIKTNLQKTSSVQLTLSNIKVSADKATLNYNAEGATKSDAILLALVQKMATSKVKSGENGGRTLSHVQIVRKIQHIALNGQTKGTESINLPSNFDAQGWELIAFLQNTSDGQIIAATKTAFAANVSASNVSLKN